MVLFQNDGRRFLFITTLFISLIGITHPLFALDIPERPASYVTDEAGLLSPPVRQRLEYRLADYERRTTNQVVVAAFPSLEGESLEDFSIRLAEKWKIGQAGRDNGVIFLIFKADRKMRIEVGYGLEGTLPDALAGQIIQQVVAPSFREGNYEEGILAGVAAIIRATEGEFFAKGGARHAVPLQVGKAQIQAIGILVVVAVVIFFIVDFFRYRRYLGDHRAYRDRYRFWEWWFRFALLLFVLSMLFRMLFYMLLFSRGGLYGSRSGFGGFSGGGGRGFGGGGGGGFGGGGASGSW